MCTHMFMATKTITITEYAYELLARVKFNNESFSDEIQRILQKKSSIMDLAGAWSNMEEKEADKMKEEITVARKNSKLRT